MNNINFKRPKHAKKNRGFYIALGVCLFAVGVAAFLTYSDFGKKSSEITNQENSTVSETNNSEKEVEVAGEVTSKADENSGKTSENEPALTTNTTATPTEPEETTPKLYIYPVGKNITKAFSGSNPVYSITLNDWRTHEGVDFSAEAGSVVKATAAGNVKDIYDDPSWGKTVIITHADNIESHYSGLGDTISVQIGENVETGKELGTVKSIPCEVLEEPHLHFAIKKDGNFIDPMSLIQQ